MRKIKLLLSLALLTLAVPQNLFAWKNGDFFTIDGIKYRVRNLQAATVSVYGCEIAGSVTIPGTVFDGIDQTFTVVAIGGSDDGTVDFSGVTAITLPNTIKYLDHNCFVNSSITTLHIPASVQDVRSQIFIGWPWEQAFNHWLPTTLTSITVDAANPYFEAADGVLYTKGKKAIIAYPQAKTGSTFSIPEGVEEIWANAFAKNTKGLKKIIIPASVKKINEKAYSICTSDLVEEFEVDSSNPYYCSDDGVIFNKAKTRLVCCPRNKNRGGSYAVPDGCTEIATYAFMWSRITSIDLNQVKTLGDRAFYGGWLSSVTLSDNLESLANNAFEGCGGFSSFSVAPGTTRYAAVDGILFSGDKKRLLRYPPSRAGAEYTIPEGTIAIANGAIQDSRNLETVNIAVSVDSIYWWAFRACAKLKNVVFPTNSKLRWMEDAVFWECNALEELAFPASLEKMGNLGSSIPRLRKVTFADGSQLREIPNSFAGNNVPLEEVTFLGSSVLERIGNNAFKGKTLLRSFDIPNTVREIGYNAFDGCTNLASVTWGTNPVITTILEGSFADSGLESIELPSSVTTIQREAFRNCNVLETVQIGARMSNISPEAFKGCYDLKNIVVDKANQTYSSIDGMLLTKDKETLVLFPPGKANDKFTLLAPSIRKIGDYAFYQNENLKNVVIPNRVTSLGKRSFGLCPNLNIVTLLCDNLIDPANIMQALNEATFDDGVTTDGYTQFDKIDLHLRKAVYDDYMANHYNTGDAVETFYQQFKSINSSFNPLLRPGQSNDKNTLEEYIAVSSDVVSLIKANNTADKTFVIPEKVYSSRTKSYKVGMIGDYAFNGCSGGFDEVVLPGEVSYIGAMAFLSTEGNTTSSSIKSIFLLDATASAETFSTTRFELDDTGNDYSEFARNTKVYVKKSAFTSPDFQNAMRRYTTRVPMPGNPSATLRPATPQMFQYKVPGITVNNTYGTFAREFDVDLAEYAKEIGEDVHVVAFTSPRDEPGSYFQPAGPDGQGGDGDQKAKYYVRMTSLKHTMADGTEVDGTYVPANTGVLLKVMTGGPVTDDGYFYCIGEDGRAAQPAPSYLVGVTRKDTILNDTGRDIFGMQKGVFQPLNGATNVTFPAHKAYLKLSGFPGATGGNANGAKVMFLFSDSPVPTEIDAFGMDEGLKPEDASPVYDLQGRRVTTPQKGLYIKNGKKVIIK